ncbi:MAG: dTDP-4-dehydrorhamnose 3,5-epimerase [Flavobacteriales bacterium]|jgi:dTDP-4-dehydrorhamnose 3,5-epimerase|nr:dTDP-4-dehydrorhamnose 3,5-epimerase [Flavobacteriales bacterium]MBT6814913.1 dTDP-4-dehydrorhamnose 3,5-epimerase [Flavobacteriales bacterium]MBT7619960.1 dTDP-4-dehydrorhamnose 3,5-epimerase [Flavobacteriales bacterium]
MKIIKTEIEGLLIIEPRVFEDERGYFFESWSKDAFENAGLDINFVQDNESLSSEGVVRGLHFQNPPFAQGKLVRVLKGSVLDVAVDIRKNSPTYGKHVSAHLSEENKTMFWIPPGFAHGFSTLENNTIFSYKCSGVYNKESEGSLMWNDTDLNIDWKIKNPIISEKDQNSALFTNFKSLF